MVRLYLTPWLARRRASADVTPIPSTEPSTATLMRGMRGHDVGAWQARLHELGFDCGSVDDVFGPLTEAATKTLQRVLGLPTTGQVDERTRKGAEDADGPTAKTPQTVQVQSGDRANLATALLDAARADIGVREERTNDGTRIREYFAGTGVTPPAHWCAAAMRFWLRAAGNACHVAPPIQGSVGAKVWAAQLEKAGRWIPASDLRREPHRLRHGMIVVWHRGAPNAPTGHIGVVATASGQWKFTSIEANSGPRSNEVAEMPHNLSDANLLGAGHID
jgi:peptidoglycan hydrolase-like protein with peptidoglycan-binding domain